MKYIAILALLGSTTAIALRDENTDINSDIGTYPKQKTRGYTSPYLTAEAFRDENHIMAGSFITVPRREDIMRNTALQVADENTDINSDIGTYPKQKTRGYTSPYLTSEAFRDENHIMAGSHITVPRREDIMRNTAIQIGSQDVYSNEVANGDKSDDKELEKENDMSDDIVDWNGHTNRGYATPYGTYNGWNNDFKNFWDQNKIMPGSHGTIPREDSGPPLGNNVRLQLSNLRIAPTNQFLQFNSVNTDEMNVQLNDLYSNELANGDQDDDKELEKEDDMSDDIVDFQGHTNRGYASPYGSYFGKPNFDNFRNENIIMPGSFGTIPRDDRPMRNSSP